MKKGPIYITKAYLTGLYNFTGDNNKPLQVPLQQLRWINYLFSINKQDTNTCVRTFSEAYKEAFSYIHTTGKRKYLMSSSAFRTFISKPARYWKYDSLTDTIHFNFDDEQLFYINFTAEYNHKKTKKDEPYNNKPALMQKANEWDIMKSASENEMKLYYFILYHKVRGTYNFINITQDELKRRLLLKNNSPKQLKLLLKKLFTKLKEKKIINDFDINEKYEIKIQKGIDRKPRSKNKKKVR